VRTIKYKRGYKYQLVATAKFFTSFRPLRGIFTRYITLTKSGELSISPGYAYDGPSGPVIDRKTNMRAALCHDALYQLMRMGELSCKRWREADREFAKLLQEDGSWGITIKIDMAGLKIAGGRAALPKNIKKVYSAP